MVGDITFGIKINADPSGYVGGVQQAISATEKLRATGSTAAQTLKEMDAEAKRVTTSTIAMGAAIGTFIAQMGREAVSAVKQWAEETIHAAAALNNLSVATGSSVESLSQITNSFKISGVGAEALALAMQRLSVGLSGTDDESGRAGKALALLGITARDPATALQELAKELDKYADGANKATLVQEILGRGSQVLIPALKDLAQHTEILSSVTAQQARDSENLERAWRSLGTEASALKTALLSDLVPAIERMITTTKLARAEGLGWYDSLRIGTTYASEMTPRIDELTKRQEALNKQLANPGNAFPDYLRKLQEEARKTTVEINILSAARARFNKSQDTEFGDLDAAMTRWGLPDAPRIKKAVEAIKAGVDEYARAIESVSRMGATAQLEFDKLFDTKPINAADRALGELMASSKWAAFTQAQKAATTAAYENVSAILNQIDARKKLFDETVRGLHAEAVAESAAQTARERAAEARRQAQVQVDDQVSRSIEELRVQNDTLEREIAVIGQSDLAHQLLASTIAYETTLRKLADDAIKNETETSLALLQALKAEYEQRQKNIGLRDTATEGVKAAQDYSREWGKAFNDVLQLGERFFTDLGTKGVNAGKNLWENFKQLAFRAFAEIASKQIMVSIGMTATGTAGSAAASTIGSSAGGLGSGLGTIVGMYDTAIGAAASVFGVSLATTSASIATLGIAMSAGAAAVGGLGAVAVAAIPVIGWIAAAAYLAYTLFSQAKGGPKQGGAFSQFSGLNMYPGETNAVNNTTMEQMVRDQQASYNNILRALGGRGSAQFGFSYDTDPEGSAQSRVSAAALVNGVSVYNARDVDAGRDDKTLQSELQQQASRAILAALKASELPQIVSDYLATIDVGTATSLAIQDALTHAQELFIVATGLAQLNLKGLDQDALAAFTTGSETIVQTLQRVSGAYFTFVDAFTTPAEKLANAQALVTSTFASLGVAVPEGITAYRQLVQSIDLSTQAGRDMFSTLITISPAFLAVANATVDATGALVDNSAAAQLLNDKLSLQAQIYALTGDAAAAAAVQEQQRQIALDALDPSLRELQAQLWGLQDAAAAASAAAQAQADADAKLAAIASKRSDLEIQIMQLEGNATGALAAQRALELAALDESLRPLQEHVYALQDEAAAAQAAAAAATAQAAIEQQRGNMRVQLLNLEGNATAALALQRELELAAIDPQLRYLQEMIYAQQDVNAATLAAAAAEKVLADIRKTQADTLALAQGDALAEAIAANGSPWDKLIAQGNSLETLTAYFDGTAAATNTLQSATQSYHQSLVQMIGTIEALKTSIAAMFQSNVRDFEMSGLDKQGQYGYLQSEVERAMEDLKTATDPARINAIASLAAADQRQAWALLSPEQQASGSTRQQFIDGANEANRLLQERLQASEEAAIARNAALVKDIGDAIKEALAASGIKDAGADIKSGGADILEAANTPKEINLHVDVTDGSGSAVGTY